MCFFARKSTSRVRCVKIRHYEERYVYKSDCLQEAEDEEGNEWKGSRLFKFQPAEQLCYFVELREKELLWQPNR